MKPIRLVILLIAASAWITAKSQIISVLPEPVSVVQGTGQFTLTSSTGISVPKGNTDGAKVAEYLSAKVKAASGIDLRASSTKQAIVLELLPSKNATIGTEGYLLDANASGVLIRANTSAGLFYGVQTLLQLLPAQIECDTVVNDVAWTVPAVSIVDYPRFAWRGMMLDVSRHFQPKEYVKSYIDRLARFKFNRFHWHLTDDNGWRLEIKSLPKLTEVGAWRVPRTGTFNSNEAPKEGEAATYGGFYTQEDIKEIVQYAKDRYVEILPEIDVPGHSMAANASYPELSVTKDPNLKVNPGSVYSKWFGNGKFEMYLDNTMNPTDEKVYQFLDKVIAEVAQMFPFEYIHMGGDECYKGYWERDANVQAFMKKNNLKDGTALQHYFTGRVNSIVQRRKKKMIGWDEILEGGTPPPGATVMSWRGTKGGIEATHKKYPVIMSPAPVYYLDMMQGDPAVEVPVYGTSRLKALYQFDIIVPEIDSAYVLGGQANLWTEQIPTAAQLEYMLYPRALAVSESLWSPRKNKQYDRFVAKVEKQFNRFDLGKVNYSTSLYDPIIKVTKGERGLVITLTAEANDVDFHYTVDNAIPSRYHPKYTGPIDYPQGADNFRVIAFRDGKPVGKLISLPYEAIAKRVTSK